MNIAKDQDHRSLTLKHYQMKIPTLNLKNSIMKLKIKEY